MAFHIINTTTTTEQKLEFCRTILGAALKGGDVEGLEVLTKNFGRLIGLTKEEEDTEQSPYDIELRERATLWTLAHHLAEKEALYYTH